MGLTLVSIPHLINMEPAAFYEKDAARYCKLSLQMLRQLASSGRVAARRHPGRMRKIYLKRDLDEYLESLERA